MKGIKASVAVGIVAGNAEKVLEVISEVTDKQKEEVLLFLKNTPITVKHIDCQEQLDVTIIVYKGEHKALVRISGFHTNIVLMKKTTLYYTSVLPSANLTRNSLTEAYYR